MLDSAYSRRRGPKRAAPFSFPFWEWAFGPGSGTLAAGLIRSAARSAGERFRCPVVGAVSDAGRTAITILAAISFCHLLNDMMQSLLPALYPMLKSSYHLSFGQVGLLTFTFQFTASLLQPLVGAMADRSPRPYSLAAGMGFTLVGLVLLAFAGSFALLLFAAALIGTGSSVFHPESSRVARMASGGKHGLAQSVFQVGGNFGTSAGPLLAAFIVLPLRSVERGVVLAHGAAGHVRAVSRRPLVQGARDSRA